MSAACPPDTVPTLQDIGAWNMKSVTNIANMFKKASIFNQDIGGWNVTSATSFSNLFLEAYAFNQVTKQSRS